MATTVVGQVPIQVQSGIQPTFNQPTSNPRRSGNYFEMLQAQVTQLGTQTMLSPSGLVQLNQPLIQSIASGGQQAVPILARFLAQAAGYPMVNPFAVVEALQVVQHLAQQRTPGVQQLYGALSKFNYHPDPYIQMYLAEVYRVLGEPQAIGPMMANLVHTAINQYPPMGYGLPPGQDRFEAWGGAISDLIAQNVARQLQQRQMV
ncbi:MAG: hypothetical protein KTR14_08560 [Vampirovibrio sp.]|nr:hypothetical protein [Vampirovibrio sp.]